MPYLNIQEASRLTGVSFTSIRRLAKRAEGYQKRYEKGKLQLLDSYLFEHYPLISSQKQLDNQTIHMVNQNNHSEDTEETVVNQAIQMDNQAPKMVNHQTKSGFNEQYYLNLIEAKETTIQVLTEQVTNKDQQLVNKDQQLNQLIERTREQNIIIQSLQEKVTRQLAPPQQDDKGIQQREEKKEVKMPFVDKVLIGVAVVVSVALLLFFAFVLLAYLNR